MVTVAETPAPQRRGVRSYEEYRRLYLPSVVEDERREESSPGSRGAEAARKELAAAAERASKA